MKSYADSKLIVVMDSPTITLGSRAYQEKDSGYRRAIEHFCKSGQVVNDLSYLFNYEINGLCRIDWNALTVEPFSPELAVYIRERLKETEYYNEAFTKEIKALIAKKRGEMKR